ncbi:hypothetical protein Q1695_011912 [Nippostrongylus brasiliensis]|nr:hypothetical protein Q1695_011912 [Nippostrongylus brasiliensis]
MYLLQVLAVSMVALSGVSALRCMAGTTLVGLPPPTTVTCAEDNKFCKITFSKNGAVTYHCDVENACKESGCFTADDGRQMCCCEQSYCNNGASSTFPFTISLIALLIIVLEATQQAKPEPECCACQYGRKA